MSQHSSPAYAVTEMEAVQRRHWTIAAIALIVLQPIGLLLASWLPQSIAWENGLLESLQNGTLFLGLVVALRCAGQWRGTRYLWWWLAIVPWWFGLLGRELAWGAAFLPPQGMTEWGPVISSQILSYKPLVKPIMVGLLAFSVVAMLASGTLKAVLHQVWSERRMLPLISIALAIVLCAVLSTASEGHAFYPLIDQLGTQVIVMEEWVEVWGYLALLLLQCCIVHRMQAWAPPRKP